MLYALSPTTAVTLGFGLKGERLQWFRAADIQGLELLGLLVKDLNLYCLLDPKPRSSPNPNPKARNGPTALHNMVF